VIQGIPLEAHRHSANVLYAITIFQSCIYTRQWTHG